MAQQFLSSEIMSKIPKSFGFRNQTINTGGFRNPNMVTTSVPELEGLTPIQEPRIGFNGRPTGEMNTTGYTMPIEIPNQPTTDPYGHPMPRFLAHYDSSGKLQKIQPEVGYQINEDTNIRPEISPTGELLNLNPFSSHLNEGGFGSFVSDALKDFGPMILAGVGANLFSGANLLGAPETLGGASASDIAAHNALAQANLGTSSSYGGLLGGGSTALTGGVAPEVGGITASDIGTQLGDFGGQVKELAINPNTSPGPNYLPQINTDGSLLQNNVPIDADITPPDTSRLNLNLPDEQIPRQYVAQNAPNISGAMSAGQTPFDIAPDITVPTVGATAGGSLLDSLGDAGKSILDFAKANPSIAGSLLGAVTGAVGAKNAPTSQTSTTSIDPQIKAEYLANLERAKQTATALQARQIAQPSQLYTDAEQKLYNLGMTPFGAADIAKFYNPYQEQVVQGALGDIERARQMQEQANMAQATGAKAFGGSRQGVVSALTNEAALRQAATTGGQLRSAGFTQAANLGLAARPLDIAGLQTSLGLGTQRTALEQARLDALRNLGQERLAITSGALGLQPADVGKSTNTPLYSSTAGNLLSGGLTGAYIGSLLDPNRYKQSQIVTG